MVVGGTVVVRVVVWVVRLDSSSEAEAELAMESDEVPVVGVDWTTSDDPDSDVTEEVACCIVGCVESEVLGGSGSDCSWMAVEIGADHALTGGSIKYACVSDSLSCTAVCIGEVVGRRG